MRCQLLKHGLERCCGNFLTTFDTVGAIHYHFRLDDRHNIGFLAQRGIPGKCVRIRTQAICRRNTVADIDYSTPLRKFRTQLVVLVESLAQAIQTFGDCFAWESGEAFSALVNFDASDHAQIIKILGERHAICCALSQCFIKQNDTTDIVCNTCGRKEHFTISTSNFLAGLRVYRIETFLNRWRTFISRQNPLPVCHHSLGNCIQLIQIHLCFSPDLTRYTGHADLPTRATRPHSAAFATA